MGQSTLNKALRIAVRDLRGNYQQHGIVAGATHFSDYWLRDMAMANLGAIALGDTDIVKRGFRFFLGTQRSDGLIAFRAGTNSVLKYLLAHWFGYRKPFTHPWYIHDKMFWRSGTMEDAYVADSFPMLFICIAEYIEATGDTKTIQPYVPTLKRLMKHYEATHVKTRDGLVTEAPYASWADSLKKQGKVLYTNVLYVSALERFCLITGKCSVSDLESSYRKKFERAKGALLDTFWNRQYLNDWIDHGTVYDSFSVDGNMLAIVFGLTATEQTEAIVDFFLSQKALYTPTPCKTNIPAYPHDLEYPLLRSLEYHNFGAGWLWLGATSVVALHKAGRQAEAKQILDTMAQMIVRDRTVYEIYDEHGQPFGNFLYQTERGFSWSAGMFIWAAKQLGISLPTD